VDLGSEKRNHPVDNSELKADKGELPVAGQQRGNEFHIAERCDGAQFRANLLLCRKNSRSFSRSPSTVKLFPVEKRSCTAALAAISPTLSPFGRSWLMEKKKRLRVQPEVSND
jgi:hypothetical protein